MLSILNVCVTYYYRNADFSLNSVWSAGLEDSATLRASDVRSPLPFTAQLHSTPNYWDDKLYNHTNQATTPISRNSAVGSSVLQVRSNSMFSSPSPCTLPHSPSLSRVKARNG